MVKTAISIFISLGLILIVSYFEIAYVNSTFSDFRELLTVLYLKVQSGKATYEDGYATLTFWEDKKDVLHVWLPHTSINNVENELSEAMGYLRQENCEDALPKIEILINLTHSIPESYAIKIKNVF
ncbi:MAG: DUF4363 family protein [Clostridia bacterium]|nr:DUF4363 family protein [Clostridia bacterium]